MPYPAAIDPSLVGEYDEYADSGGGYFFDEVLEYRVWCCSNSITEVIDTDDYKQNNASNSNHHAYYRAFATYQRALAFAASTQNAETPVALVRQLEWVDQPSRGVYLHHKGERITEWQAEWLARGTREANDIPDFLQKHTQAK